MAKNFFKKESATASLMNVAIGGASNVAIDTVISSMQDEAKEASKTLEDREKTQRYINIGKIIGGILIGSMSSNKVIKAVGDGVATVGVSNLVASFMGDTAAAGNSNGTAGLPDMMGAVSMRPAHTAYVERAKTRAKRTAVSGKPNDVILD